LSVPASAIFSPEDLTMPGDTTPAVKPADAVPPVVAPPAAPAVIAPTPAEKAAADKVVADKAATDKTAADKLAAEKAAATAPETKVKIGDKEYTRAELEKLLAERAAQPAPAPAAALAPATAKPPTPEEVAVMETEWCAKFAKDEKLNLAPTKDEVETILSGGDEAVALLGKKFTDVLAKAVMLARKSVYSDMNPMLSRLEQAVTPLVSSNFEVEKAAAEHQFFTAYADFKPHAETVRQVGEALLARYPQECAKMTREQLLAEVAAQSDRVLQTEYKRWNPTAPATGTWRDALKAAPAAAPAAVVPPAPVVAAPAAAPAAPAVLPPASNSPAGTAAGGVGKDWQKSVAQSLAD
jgi:hypothetical protein